MYANFVFLKIYTKIHYRIVFPYATQAIAKERHLGVPEIKRKFVIINVLGNSCLGSLREFCIAFLFIAKRGGKGG